MIYFLLLIGFCSIKSHADLTINLNIPHKNFTHIFLDKNPDKQKPQKVSLFEEKIRWENQENSEPSCVSITDIQSAKKGNNNTTTLNFICHIKNSSKKDVINGDNEKETIDKETITEKKGYIDFIPLTVNDPSDEGSSSHSTQDTSIKDFNLKVNETGEKKLQSLILSKTKGSKDPIFHLTIDSSFYSDIAAKMKTKNIAALKEENFIISLKEIKPNKTDLKVQIKGDTGNPSMINSSPSLSLNNDKS